jgi:hypothetical protein
MGAAMEVITMTEAQTTSVLTSKIQTIQNMKKTKKTAKINEKKMNPMKKSES